MTRLYHPLQLIGSGRKAHPLQQVTMDELFASRDRRRAGRERRGEITRQREAERRARRYQLEDEQRAFDREQLLAEEQFGRQMALQDADLAGRLQIQGRDIQSRYGLAEFGAEQDRLLGQDRFRQQLAIGQQGFEQDLALADQRLEAEIDLVGLQSELQADRDERLQGFSLEGKEFDALTRGEEQWRQGIIQNWLGDELYDRIGDRDKELFAQNLNMAKIREGWNTIREFRQEGFQQRRDQSNHDFAKEMVGLQAEWQMKAETARTNLERQGIMTDQFFTLRYAEMAKGQEKVRRGITMLSDDDKADLRSLWSAYSKEVRNPKHDAMEKSFAINGIIDQMAAIYETAPPMPAEMQGEQREETLRRLMGDNYDPNLPWQIDHENDTVQLPRGWQMPEQKSPAEMMKEMMGDYEDNLKVWQDTEIARRKYQEEHMEEALDKHGEPIPGKFIFKSRSGYPTSHSVMIQDSFDLYPHRAKPKNPMEFFQGAGFGMPQSGLGGALPGAGVRVDNPDGSFSTEVTIGTNINGREYVIPTLVGGVQLTEDQAVAEAKRRGLENYPSFDSVEEAEQYAQARSQELGGGGVPPQGAYEPVVPTWDNPEPGGTRERIRSAAGRVGLKKMPQVAAPFQGASAGAQSSPLLQAWQEDLGAGAMESEVELPALEPPSESEIRNAKPRDPNREYKHGEVFLAEDGLIYQWDAEREGGWIVGTQPPPSPSDTPEAEKEKYRLRNYGRNTLP